MWTSNRNLAAEINYWVRCEQSFSVYATIRQQTATILLYCALADSKAIVATLPYTANALADLQWPKPARRICKHLRDQSRWQVSVPRSWKAGKCIGLARPGPAPGASRQINESGLWLPLTPLRSRRTRSAMNAGRGRSSRTPLPSPQGRGYWAFSRPTGETALSLCHILTIYLCQLLPNS